MFEIPALSLKIPPKAASMIGIANRMLAVRNPSKTDDVRKEKRSPIILHPFDSVSFVE